MAETVNDYTETDLGNVASARKTTSSGTMLPVPVRSIRTSSSIPVFVPATYLHSIYRKPRLCHRPGIRLRRDSLFYA